MTRAALPAFALMFAVAIVSARTLGAFPPSPGRAPSASAPPVFPTLPCCATEAAYEAVVQAFAQGDRTAALIAVARAPVQQLKRAVGAFRPRDAILGRAATAIHVLLAANAVNADQLRFHLDCADAVLRRSKADPSFTATCVTAAVDVCIVAGDFDRASDFVKLGAGIGGTPAAMRLADGRINETETAAARFHDPQSGSELRAAEAAYRAALQSDPDLAEARLRLGRVLTLRSKDVEARSDLDQVSRDTKDPALAYLAHLFLADLAVRMHDAAAARREYEEAIALEPAFPTPYVGISNLAEQAGNTAQAVRYASAWSAIGQQAGDDPWMRYEAGAIHTNSDLESLLQRALGRKHLP